MSSNYNEPITFGATGSALRLNCVGIDFSDNTPRSWTTDTLVQLDLRLPPTRDDVTIEINTDAYITDEVPQHQVFAYLGGAFVGFWRVRRYGKLSARINRTLFTGRPAILALALPNAESPYTLGLGDDRRELGLHLETITFRLGQ